MKNYNHFLKTLFISCLVCLIPVANTLGQKKPGKKTTETVSAKAPMTAAEIDQKVQELLGKMTIEEKVGQMTQINLNVVLKGGYGNNDGSIDTNTLKKAVV